MSSSPLAAEPVRVFLASERETWSYRYLADTFARDAAIASGRLSLDSEVEVAEKLKFCTVLILLDVSVEKLRDRPKVAETIKDFVVRGGGLIVAPGESWRGKDFPLASLLPVEQGDADKVADNDAPQLSRPQVTGAGLRSPILRLVDDPMRNQQLWREELDAGFGEPLPVTLKKNCTALAVDPLRQLAGDDIPVLAVRDAGDGRVVFVNNPQLWRWRVKPIGNYHSRFWKQAARYAAGEDE